MHTRLSILGAASALLALPLLTAALAPPPRLAPPTHEATSCGPERFVHSERCARCHAWSPWSSAMQDEKDRVVAPVDLWRSSMMANSARDPLWRAAVRAELATQDEDEHAEIEALCMRCHAPMASAHAGDEGVRLERLADGHERAELARDGVSCTVCHQITDENFGEASSFTGRFKIDENNRIFGPHDDPFWRPMQMHTGKRATPSKHILASELCATCHTLTHDSHAEQAPYLEWRNSEFHETKSCQDCHVPTDSVDGKAIRARIAHRPNGRDWNTELREPYGRHVFVGGNTLIPAILRDNAEELGVTAPREDFDATITATRAQLRTASARVELAATREGAELQLRVTVHNECGHKFPTGYPARRAWLRVRVLDADERVVFESGAWDREGRILDAEGRPLAFEALGGALAPHQQEIRDASSVQIFESIMKDAEGKPTWRLLQAKGWIKDNRLLPRGWRAEHELAHWTRPVLGAQDAGAKADFAPGRSATRYAVDLEGASGPFDVEARLVYQTLAPRYAQELFALEGDEIRAFERMWRKADRAPVLVDVAKKRVD